jgi:predicted membrane-bound spermidine synthase
MDNDHNSTQQGFAKPALLLLSVFVIATCGLIYELVAGTLASYVLGDSITQFSTIIGTYLFAMGVGSYLSRLPFWVAFHQHYFLYFLSKSHISVLYFMPWFF